MVQSSCCQPSPTSVSLLDCIVRWCDVFVTDAAPLWDIAITYSPWVTLGLTVCLP